MATPPRCTPLPISPHFPPRSRSSLLPSCLHLSRYTFCSTKLPPSFVLLSPFRLEFLPSPPPDTHYPSFSFPLPPSSPFTCLSSHLLDFYLLFLYLLLSNTATSFSISSSFLSFPPCLQSLYMPSYIPCSAPLRSYMPPPSPPPTLFPSCIITLLQLFLLPSSLLHLSAPLQPTLPPAPRLLSTTFLVPLFYFLVHLSHRPSHPPPNPPPSLPFTEHS